jgi:DNA-binding transcriptional MerR regulator
MSRTFTSVDDRVLCEVIAQARNRLVFIAPGIRPKVAEALADAMKVVPTSTIHLVLDVDAEVCRLGYGDKDFKGMEYLRQAASAHSLTVNHHPGIRIGLLIADETTLVYSPTPELIETESRQPNKPNAIVLHNELPTQLAEACAVGSSGFKTLEIGLDQIDKRKVEAVKRDLADRPPKEFNVARVERVFSSLLQYVEWKIKDYQLGSRTLKLNAELFGVRDADVVKRLTNNYRLFSETDALTVEIPHIGDDGKPHATQKVKFDAQSIDRERKRIKKRFVIDAGRFGTLILRRDVSAFEKEIALLKARIAEYRAAVRQLIEKRIQAIVDELLTALHDRLKTAPPDEWRSRFLGKELSDADVDRLFREDIEGEVNRVRTDFEPKVFTAYKDVTYQTFKDPKFRELVEKRFGKKAIDEIFNEHDAAPEQQHGDSDG